MIPVLVRYSLAMRARAQGIIGSIRTHPLFCPISWESKGSFDPAALERTWTGAQARAPYAIIVTSEEEIYGRHQVRGRVLFECAWLVSVLGLGSVAVVVTIGLATARTISMRELEKATRGGKKPSRSIKQPVAELVHEALAGWLDSCESRGSDHLCAMVRAHAREGHATNGLMSHAHRTLLEFQLSPCSVFDCDDALQVLKDCVRQAELAVGPLRSIVHEIVDLGIANQSQRDLVYRTFGAFIARVVLERLRSDSVIDGIALAERNPGDELVKESDHLSSRAVWELGVLPIVVRPNGIWGHRGHVARAVFVHDFLVSGATPIKAIQRLRNAGVAVDQLLALTIRQDKIDMVRRESERANVSFRALFVHSGGNLALYDGQWASSSA